MSKVEPSFFQYDLDTLVSSTELASFIAPNLSHLNLRKPF